MQKHISINGFETNKKDEIASCAVLLIPTPRENIFRDRKINRTRKWFPRLTFSVFCMIFNFLNVFLATFSRTQK